MKVTATKPYFSPEGIDFICRNFKDILEGKGFLSSGKHCETFEKNFAAYIGSKFAATTNSGTSAIEIICRALGVQGGEVIVPTNTFAATAFAVISAGNTPVFADCGDDLNIDPGSVLKCITPKTKAVVTVHIGGLVSPSTTELVDICQKKGIYLIEDACHAHGSTLDGKKAGTFGIAGAFSFFSTKVMTTGEGGMIVTNDDALYKASLVLRDQAKIVKDGYQNYHEFLGYNWRMAEVQALMGITQLEMLDKFIARRNEIARIYDQELAHVADLSILKKPANVGHNYYKYIGFLKNSDRNKLQRRMKDEYTVNMGGYVYEIPLHQQPVFKKYINHPLPRSEDLCRRHICPPIYYGITDEEVRYVADSIRRCLS